MANKLDGPILGHIEHPQNCFLSTVDVDYSGGKDMSFIETVTPSTTTGEGEDAVKTATCNSTLSKWCHINTYIQRNTTTYKTKIYEKSCTISRRWKCTSRYC